MYYANPDGNQMKFQVDTFGTNEETNAYVHGPHFSANPIGIEYDADVWLAGLCAGVPVSEFLTRHIDEPISPIRGAEMKV
jgi:hypothetical protein